MSGIYGSEDGEKHITTTFGTIFILSFRWRYHRNNGRRISALQDLEEFVLFLTSILQGVQHSRFDEMIERTPWGRLEYNAPQLPSSRIQLLIISHIRCCLLVVFSIGPLHSRAIPSVAAHSP